MADAVSIARMREQALSRIVAEAGEIAAALGIPPPTITQHSRDRAYLEMARLTDVAEWLQTANAALKEHPAMKRTGTRKSRAEGRDTASVDISEANTHEEHHGVTTQV